MGECVCLTTTSPKGQKGLSSVYQALCPGGPRWSRWPTGLGVSLALSQPLGGHLHDPGMSFLIRVSLFAWDLGSCWIVYADSVT